MMSFREAVHRNQQHSLLRAQIFLYFFINMEVLALSLGLFKRVQCKISHMLCWCQLSEVKRKSLSCVWLFGTPWTIYTTWHSPSQNTGVGSFSLLQGIFSTQGPNPGFLHCRRILYHQITGFWATREAQSELSQMKKETGAILLSPFLLSQW